MTALTRADSLAITAAIEAKFSERASAMMTPKPRTIPDAAVMAALASPEIVVLNKSDAIPKEALARKRAALEKASGQKIFVMSGVSGEGLKEVLHALARAVEKSRNKARPKKAVSESWVP